jgi:hypothetical protein
VYFAVIVSANVRHRATGRRPPLLGADHKAIQRWHAQGIDLIVKALRGGIQPG